MKNIDFNKDAFKKVLANSILVIIGSLK